jgi:hypothetical protein
MGNLINLVATEKKMSRRDIKIFTHESIVHYQLDAIEKLLQRDVGFRVVLNVKGVVSNVQFAATFEEIESIKNNLSFKIYIKANDDTWVVSP